MTLIELLNSTVSSELKVQEDFRSFEISFEINGALLVDKIYNYDYINTVFSYKNSRDDLKIFINFNGESKAVFRNITDIETTITDNSSVLFDSDNTYKINLQITKEFVEHCVSIYNFDAFQKWFINSNNLQECWKRINSFAFIVNEPIIFHVLDVNDINFYTSRFVFTSDHTKIPSIESSHRDELLESRKDHSFVSSPIEFKILPDDFYWLKKQDYPIINLFDKLCLMLIYSFLVDITEVKEDSIYYKLYGYRTIKNDLDLRTIGVDFLDEYYKIYLWIFHDTNHSSMSDKLGIARNLITLHLKNNSLCELEGDVVTAIKSNFDIYLKENVQRYLEVKNQVSTFIYDMSQKAEEEAKSLIETFKSNLLIFISYFLSIFIVTAIDKGKFINVFTFEVTTITLLILLMSWFYRQHTIDDIKKKKKRFEAKYKSFKKRYSDILDNDNLQAMFDGDTDHISDIQYIDETLTKYNKLWKNFIIFAGVVTLAFCIIHDTMNMMNYVFMGVMLIMKFFV